MKLYYLAFEVGNADYESLHDDLGDELMAVGLLADVIYYNSDSQKVDIDDLVKQGINPLDLAKLSIGESDFTILPAHDAVYTVVYKVTGYMKRYYHTAGQAEISRKEFMRTVRFNQHLLDELYEPVAGDWKQTN